VSGIVGFDGFEVLHALRYDSGSFLVFRNSKSPFATFFSCLCN
jgi:hypothetical protein